MPTITTCRAAGEAADAAARAPGASSSGTASAAHSARPATASHARRTRFLTWPTVSGQDAPPEELPPSRDGRDGRDGRGSAGADRLVGRAGLDRERAGGRAGGGARGRAGGRARR